MTIELVKEEQKNNKARYYVRIDGEIKFTGTSIEDAMLEYRALRELYSISPRLEVLMREQL